MTGFWFGGSTWKLKAMASMWLNEWECGWMRPWSVWLSERRVPVVGSYYWDGGTEAPVWALLPGPKRHVFQRSLVPWGYCVNSSSCPCSTVLFTLGWLQRTGTYKSRRTMWIIVKTTYKGLLPVWMAHSNITVNWESVPTWTGQLCLGWLSLGYYLRERVPFSKGFEKTS